MSLVASKFINSFSDINPGSNICFNVKKMVPGVISYMKWNVIRWPYINVITASHVNIFEYISKTKSIPKHIDQCKTFITSIFLNDMMEANN